MNWKSIYAPRKRDEKTANQKHKASKEKPKTNPIPGAAPEAPSVNNAETTRESHHKSPHWSWRILEGGALSAAIVYAILTFFMWNDSHNNFIIDERAWLRVRETIPPTAAEGMVLAGTYTLHNTGKTPARKVWSECNVSVQKYTDIIAFDYSGLHSVADHGIITPDSDTDISLCMNGSTEQPAKLSKDQTDDLLNGKAYLAMYGRARWNDIFGRLHWMQFCIWKPYRVGNYNAQRCTDYTDTGDGIPPSWHSEKEK